MFDEDGFPLYENFLPDFHDQKNVTLLYHCPLLLIRLSQVFGLIHKELHLNNCEYPTNQASLISPNLADVS